MYLFIHRKDLRVKDMKAFSFLHELGKPGLHLVIVDPQLLSTERGKDHSGRYFLDAVARLTRDYAKAGRELHLVYGNPEDVVEAVCSVHNVSEIVFHEDYTPYAVRRDQAIRERAGTASVPVYAIQDHTLAEAEAFQSFTEKKEPYKVFTPFYRKMKTYLELFYRPGSPYSVRDLQTAELDAGLIERFSVPSEIAAILSGSAKTAEPEPAEVLAAYLDDGLLQYDDLRDDYGNPGTSGISGLLNTGALSIRTVYEELQGREGAEAWLRQLIWREFYMYQAQMDPDFFRYEQVYDLSGLSDRHFEAWRQGRTGIPVIDAAMRQLNETGVMPNRLRMITAMFLTKNLLCPFPLGEAYFRTKLADYDNVLNRGGWLWSSSIGFDAAPYFRIMNPVTQSERYDPQGRYIRTWLPELEGVPAAKIHQPRPDAIVDLKLSRLEAIERYKVLLGGRKE
ncbi:cryptochrome/photolyase family protein [Paenibacillus gansuensis]|uniref:Cryptochrome/photolyase family protein n=1 Tax=Paenibacillus gansuensis TaxID=306542 RepID=A0ABW5PKE6_9BACL